MERERRDEIAWTLMIAHYKKVGIRIHADLPDEMTHARTGVLPRDLRHLMCCLIFEVGDHLPWLCLGGGILYRRPPNNAVWPVFREIVTDELKITAHSPEEAVRNLETAIQNTIPDLAARANIPQDAAAAVFVLATNEILDNISRVRPRT